MLNINYRATIYKSIITFTIFQLVIGLSLNDAQAEVTIEAELRTYRDNKKLGPIKDNFPWEKCIQDTFSLFENRDKKPTADDYSKAIHEIWRATIDENVLKNVMDKLKNKNGAMAYTAQEIKVAIAIIYPPPPPPPPTYKIPTVTTATKVPAKIPAGLKITTIKGPNVLQSSKSHPVLKWNGYTYWALSHRNNQVAMTLVAYNDAGKIVKQWYKRGARYLWKITADNTAKKITIWGQANKTIVMTWDELRVP